MILSAYKGKLGKPEVDAIMESQNLGPTSRAEELDIAQMLALAEAVRERLGFVL